MIKNTEKNMVRLIYVSRMSKTCGPKELENILAVSRKNNQAMGVTGALCYSPNGFVQCIEGSPEAVNELFRRIAADDRNTNVMLLDYSPAENRLFGEWSMAYMRDDHFDKHTLKKHGLEGVFDPYAVNADQALGLLLDTARERAAFLAKQAHDI